MEPSAAAFSTACPSTESKLVVTPEMVDLRSLVVAAVIWLKDWLRVDFSSTKSSKRSSVPMVSTMDTVASTRMLAVSLLESPKSEIPSTALFCTFSATVVNWSIFQSGI